MSTHFALLGLAAFVAGVLNAVAGGGAFISFPCLVFAGVPPVAANATSTVALFPGQVMSAWTYRRVIMAAPGIPVRAFVGISTMGGLVGGLLLLATPGTLFSGMIPWLLAFATVIFALGNFTSIFAQQVHFGPRILLVAQLAISIYGGFFGGGVGILMLAALTLYGLRDIHTMNGLKVMLAALMNGAAVCAFIVAGAVHWPETLVMAGGSILGGYIGAAKAPSIDQRVLKAAVVALGIGLSLYFFLRAMG